MEVRGAPEPKSSSVEVSRAPEWDLGRRSGLLWGGQGEAGGWVFLPLLALESDGKAVGGGGLCAVWGGEVPGSQAGPPLPQAGPTWCVPSTSRRCSSPMCSPWSPSCCSTCLMTASTRSVGPAWPVPAPAPAPAPPHPTPSQQSWGPSSSLSTSVIGVCPAQGGLKRWVSAFHCQTRACALELVWTSVPHGSSNARSWT